MLKKTITYTGFDGLERTEDFFFNLSKSEIMEMQLSTEGGYTAMLERIVNAKDLPALVSVFKELILKSYGEKSADGKHFVKSPELSEAFTQTPAYDILYMELVTDDEAASAFIKGLFPADLATEVAKLEKKNELEVVK